MLSERSISSAAQIPVPDPNWVSRGVSLLRVNDLGDRDVLHQAGAMKGRYGWWVRRSDPFPFDMLEQHLPRMARRSIVPEIVDLIPASAWFASLANMLTSSAWARLRDPVIARDGGCQECGARSGLEAHESWSYDAALRRQMLSGIRCLCFKCHETQHLGRANVNGKFDVVFDRLCRMNRLRPEERHSFQTAIFERWKERSLVEWELDLSIDDDLMLEMKSSILYAGDNWVVQPANGDRGEVACRIINAEILSDSRRLVIVPIGTTAEITAGIA